LARRGVRGEEEGRRRGGEGGEEKEEGEKRKKPVAMILLETNVPTQSFPFPPNEGPRTLYPNP
jgi:hypothetical protein